MESRLVFCHFSRSLLPNALSPAPPDELVADLSQMNGLWELNHGSSG
jgi:hypothetical protein